MSDKEDPTLLSSWGGISVPSGPLSADELIGLTAVWKLEDAYRTMDNLSPEMRKQVLNSYCVKCGRSKLLPVTDLRQSMFRVFAQCNCKE